MKEVLIKEYNNTKINPIPFIPKKNEFKPTFINGCKLEILGEVEGKYKVEFIDNNTNSVFYENEIQHNMWCKSNRKYFTDATIKVTDLNSNEIAFEHSYDAKGKRVYIHFASKALGDTIAWFPYAEEFRRKHKCQVIVSTFHNDFFINTYPKIEFVSPGDEVHNLYAMYEIGWHYNNDQVDYDRHTLDFKTISLQRASSDILGLEHKEIKPRLSFANQGPFTKEDYICIAPHASAHAKYWNRPGGWQDVIDHFNNKGYKVVMITQELLNDEWHDSKLGGTLNGVIDKTGDFPLSERANDIMNAKAFVGLGSGLSWLAWALRTPVVMISGFSEGYSEFEDCERITSPKGKCSGCFNRHQLDAGDWEWCPDHKSTDRHFECTKSISSKVVIEAIERQLEKNS